MRARVWLRGGLVFLLITEVATGAWQFLLPRSFFTDLSWVAMYPPFNEHLVRDVGGLNLALAVVLGGAVWTMERRMVLTALLAYLTYSLSHWAFHTLDIGHHHAAGAVQQSLTLAVGVVIPVGLLLARHAPREGR